MYHLPRICHTLVPEIRVHTETEMVHVFQYIDMLTCVIYNCMHSTEHCEQQLSGKTMTGGTRVCREPRQVGECADTWYNLLIQ